LSNADLPYLVTVRGLTRASRAAWVSETLLFRIFEIASMTRSQVSLNVSGFAAYWASFRGAVGFFLARGLAASFFTDLRRIDFSCAIRTACAVTLACTRQAFWQGFA